jgi:hypothetical protein
MRRFTFEARREEVHAGKPIRDTEANHRPLDRDAKATYCFGGEDCKRRTDLGIGLGTNEQLHTFS